MKRTYLDWNATAPLRPEARAAMLAAMDCLGNPSSVHAEGRATKAIVEKARGQVADLVGCDWDEVVFTSGATEAASGLMGRFEKFMWPETAHDCIISNVGDHRQNFSMGCFSSGTVATGYGYAVAFDSGNDALFVSYPANGETGVLDLDVDRAGNMMHGKVLEDAVQCYGKVNHSPVKRSADFSLVSAHKFGGPKGAGALFVSRNEDIGPMTAGGGQEKGRRSGTENVVGIAGMGAAAEAAAKDLKEGLWQIVEQNRNVFEERLLNEVPELIIFGKDVPRLPNTSYIAVPGWKAETQVMLMDLAGFAVSAGSACSSGKVKASRVLKAMGYDEITASSAIRVSIGPGTTAAELDSFATAWLTEYKRFKARREGN